MPTTEEEIAELRRRIAELEKTAPRPTTPRSDVKFERIDPSARLSMPPSAIRAMAEACPDSLLQAIVHDNRPRPLTGSMLEHDDRPPPLNVAVERPLKPPAGVQHVDALCDVQDALDRRDLERKLRR
jgi:hypothetical protein